LSKRNASAFDDDTAGIRVKTSDSIPNLWRNGMSFSHDSEIGRGGGNAVWAGKVGRTTEKKGRLL